MKELFAIQDSLGKIETILGLQSSSIKQLQTAAFGEEVNAEGLALLTRLVAVPQVYAVLGALVAAAEQSNKEAAEQYLEDEEEPEIGEIEEVYDRPTTVMAQPQVPPVPQVQPQQVPPPQVPPVPQVQPLVQPPQVPPVPQVHQSLAEQVVDILDREEFHYISSMQVGDVVVVRTPEMQEYQNFFTITNTGRTPGERVEVMDAAGTRYNPADGTMYKFAPYFYRPVAAPPQAPMPTMPTAPVMPQVSAAAEQVVQTVAQTVGLTPSGASTRKKGSPVTAAEYWTMRQHAPRINSLPEAEKKGAIQALATQLGMSEQTVSRTVSCSDQEFTDEYNRRLAKENRTSK